MKLIVKDRNNVPRLNKILEWFIYIIAHSIIIYLISVIFKTIDIDNSNYGIYPIVASLIIYLLNKTIKPILFRITVPITGITMGLFYPCLNILILKITDFILGSHFETSGIITLFLTAVLISFINILIDELLIKPTIKRSEKDE